ncbi:uncharacterized protein LOC124939720 [Impatiens glandulifera]|uniref:uncharacterized protein LOC124939720 n=1 Tax=Impatiens glandulifera TaxID=253017 RepID=UPI001FB17C86|nr:uncharacterized protein LOC124939720 [Impatiens glandulifera]
MALSMVSGSNSFNISFRSSYSIFAIGFVSYYVNVDCAKRDPEDTEDSERNLSELFSEELKLWKVRDVQTWPYSDKKKVSSQYQKEADKCNSGMETCEEAREKAEAVLLGQKKLSAMWELRARQKGWKA